MFWRHPILSVLTLAYLAFVGWVTLQPQPDFDPSGGIVDEALIFLRHVPQTSWLTLDDVEFMANIAMFVPVGVFFLLLFGRRQWWLGMLMSFVMTVGIETAQHWIPGRVSDVGDVVSNTAGGVIGVLFALVITAPAARRRRRAARLVPATDVVPLSR
jgi:glycopeptide antibiotics resistance protein